MIIVCGIPSEAPVAMVLAAAERLGHEVVVLNQRHADSTDLELRIGAGGASMTFHDLGGPVDTGSATGAFVRLSDYRELPEYNNERLGAERRRQRIAAWHALINDWLETAPFMVMNRIRPSNTNMSKPYQAQLIARAALKVPKTLVTNRVEMMQAFRRECGRIIFKSISAHRSIVREVCDEDERRLGRLRLLPTQFQEYVAGDDVRVHLVGDEIFATRIASDVVDYRYAASEGGKASFSPTTLPDEVAAACRRLSRQLDLPLAGIDLKEMANGQYVCFEVNPSPAFSYYQDQTGQPIADAIVRALAGS